MGNNKVLNANNFRDAVDVIIQLNKPSFEGRGEDSFYCGSNSGSALVSVCDGSGGIGAKTYDTLSGHTGAYIASRLASGAIHDWYHDTASVIWSDAAQMADDINRYINKAYDVCEPYAVDNVKIRGSLVRKLPTTLALAYASKARNGIRLDLVWAGDSRVYLLDSKGLAQLTLDDANVQDALENLTSDSPMTNVISGDRNYKLNTRTIFLNEPALVFACTDGCFGYVSSPMEFEHIILRSLADSKTPESFRDKMAEQFNYYAGDDYAMCLTSFGFGSFADTCKAFRKRLALLEKNYIIDNNAEDFYERVEGLWNEYKADYERYLNKDQDHD